MVMKPQGTMTTVAGAERIIQPPVGSGLFSKQAHPSPKVGQTRTIPKFTVLVQVKA
jgi:hypothetical protein